jgi:glucose/arabinose dehydrogenase
MVLLALAAVGYFTGSFDPQQFDEMTEGKGTPAEFIVLQEAFTSTVVSEPTEMVPIPGSNRFLLTEQRGSLRLLDPTSQTPAPVLYDVSPKLARGPEVGFLGVACHPDFEQNGFVFLNYTAKEPLRSVVSRITVDPKTMKVVAESESIFLEVEQPAPNHNGGKIVFGPDGMLYIGLGDGGGAGDPWGNGQNRKTLLGSILRLDVDYQADGLAYAIPDDNPFKNSEEGFRPEIWAWGLRNPWKFSFDSSTGKMWAGDVGQNKIEEVDVIVGGGNYGWNLFEGSARYDEGIQPQGNEILPVYEYPRRQGQSVTGGFVYHGDILKEQLDGQYIFGDFSAGRIWSLNENHRPRFLIDSDQLISSFVQDNDGELYILTYPGKIFQLRAP